MKKFFTLRNIVLCCGALFLLVAFFLSFAASLHFSAHGLTAEVKNIVWGANKLITNGTEVPFKEGFGIDKAGPAVLPFVGIILMILAAIGAILVALLVKAPWAKWVVVGLAVVAIAGAIFQFFAFDQTVRAIINETAKEAGITDKEAIKEAIEEAKEMYADLNPKATVNVIMGVLGIVGGLALCGSQFLPEKK